MKHDDYTVGWICALSIEMAAAKGMLDEEHQDLPVSRGDSNQYTLGRIGSHNVVIACLPDGIYGTTSAATVAKGMLLTFQSIKVGLMVGIGGGVPHLPGYDIRLGDVVVSVPRATSGGIIQYDLGKTVRGGQFHRVGSLNGPPPALLTAVARLRAKHLTKGDELLKHISTMIERYPKMQDLYAYRDTQSDQLFEASYEHREGETTCAQCDVSQLVHRRPWPRYAPRIHYGLIASGNQVIKDAQTRDLLRARLWDEAEGEILCFEMEAAGLMNSFPCLVIRGISDYTDTHKNKDWQHRAAATASAYAKELLYDILGSQVTSTQTVAQTLRGGESVALAADPKSTATDQGSDLSGSTPTSDDLGRMTPREYHRHVVSEFIDENLPEFYHQNDSLRRDLAQKAAVRAEEVTAEFGLRSELTKKVARLALYDFVILCGRLLRLHFVEA
jgi:nucleoside phosphorylase